MNETKPKICLLIGHFLPIYSGASLQAFRLLKKLQQDGVQTMVVTIGNQSLPESEKIEGIPVYRVRKPAGDWTPEKILRFWCSLFFKLFQQRKNFDIIHLIGAHLQLSIAGPISRLFRKKSLVKLTLARSDLAGLNQGRWGKLQKSCLDAIDRYISISQEITDELHSSPLSDAKVLEIPNGVDTTQFFPWSSAEEKTQARKEYQFNEEPIVLYVGIINQRKGIDLLIEAWRQVKAQNLAGKLLLVGPEENTTPDLFTDRIKEKIEDYSLSESVIFWGKEENVARLLRSGDLLILSSRSEGLPNVVLEAMSSGLPVLASSTAGTEVALIPEKEGLVFKLEDPADFAQKLILLLKNRQKREQLGVAARQRIEADFSLDLISRRYQKVYRELLT